jgi:hypothetical protein
MIIHLCRYESTDHGTFGRIQIDGKYFHTLELPWLNNKPNVSCIPIGTYDCETYPSSRFGTVYLVKGVPGRSGILIHQGNFGGNKLKGLKSNIEGCILLGKTRGIISGQKCVLNSRIAVKEFMDTIHRQPFTLKIENTWGDNGIQL